MAVFQWRLAFWLGTVWTLSVLYGEMGIYWHNSLSCDWPKIGENDNNFENKFAKVIVIGSPKVSTYFTGEQKTFSILKIFENFFSNLYLKRVFFSLVEFYSPDFVFIMGDLFYKGSNLSDDDYEHTLTRFKHMFFDAHKLKKKIRKKRAARENFQIFTIPGKSDLGVGESSDVKYKAIDRYNNRFGNQLNFSVPIGFSRFCHIDSYSFSNFFENNNTDGNEMHIVNEKNTNNALDFLNHMLYDKENDAGYAKNIFNNSNVLFSHQELSRSDHIICDNNKNSIFQAAREKYLLSKFENDPMPKSASDILMKTLNPSWIISSSDVPCIANRSHNNYHWMEISPGSFSRNADYSKSSFALLSVSSVRNLSNNNTILSFSKTPNPISAKICYGPSMGFLHFWYVLLLASTFASLLLWPSNKHVPLPNELFSSCFAYLLRLRSSYYQKVKVDEDSPGDMEMMFDAEGNMILVRKPEFHDSTSAIDSFSSAVDKRGVAQPRGGAGKRPVEGASEVSTEASSTPQHYIQIDRTPTSASIPSSKLLRSRRSRNLLDAAIGAMGPLCILVGLELTLYVGLIAKDWT